MIINTTAVFGSFLILFVGGILLFWPGVPWVGLMVVTIGLNAVLPVLLYPVSKTLWMALELSWHPLEEHEIAEAERAVSNKQ